MLKDILKFQIVNSLTNTTKKELATFINKCNQTGTVEKGFQHKSRNAYSKCNDFFDRSVVESLDETTLQRFSLQKLQVSTVTVSHCSLTMLFTLIESL